MKTTCSRCKKLTDVDAKLVKEHLTEDYILYLCWDCAYEVKAQILSHSSASSVKERDPGSPSSEVGVNRCNSEKLPQHETPHTSSPKVKAE